MPYFDCHTHVISRDPDRYPLAPLGGHQSTWSQERPADVGDLLRQLDAAEVQKAALVQASTAYGFDNSYAADALEQHPDRFVGVCSVDFLSDSALEALNHWIDERGFSGVRIRAADGSTKVPTPGKGLDDPRMDPVWANLAERRLPTCIQMHSQHAPVLASVLAKFPGLQVVLDHGARPRLDGGPPYDGVAELGTLAKFGGVFLKITPVTLQRAEQEAGGNAAALMQRLIAEFGHERVVWGSNFPASAGDLRELRQLVETAFAWLDSDRHRAVMCGNAAALYGVDVG